MNTHKQVMAALEKFRNEDDGGDGTTSVVEREAAAVVAALTPSPEGGDFHDELYGARVVLILDPNVEDETGNEIDLTVGATTGSGGGLTIYLRAKDESRLATLAAVVSDAERLDALQARVDQHGELLLHNGSGKSSGYVGLGLKNTGRTLREAIDQSAALTDKGAA